MNEIDPYLSLKSFNNYVEQYEQIHYKLKSAWIKDLNKSLG